MPRVGKALKCPVPDIFPTESLIKDGLACRVLLSNQKSKKKVKFMKKTNLQTSMRKILTGRTAAILSAAATSPRYSVK